MAKPNYSFEKRQRELAKRKKKEEKAAKKAGGGGEEEMNPNDAAMSLGGRGPDTATESEATTDASVPGKA
ncbi:MAG: hypothetical protein KA387_05675 [Rubrivivax sp.]|nr:hypothetical protein [Rubrivivax sp.]